MRKSLILALALASTPAGARDRDGLPGSAIAVEYTLQHDVVRPNEDVTLLACITNQNPASTRSVQTGDRFEFHFPFALDGLEPPMVNCLDGTLEDTDFTATLDGQVLRFEFVGETMTWPPGDGACVHVRFRSPARPASVRSRQIVGNEGAFSHAAPFAIVLGVSDQVGTFGPTGPVGPAGPVGAAGPAGATGPSGAGARAFAVSTAAVEIPEGQPPQQVPGLEVDIDVAEGSMLEIALEGLPNMSRHLHGQAPTLFSPECVVDRQYFTRLSLELDGSVLATRILGSLNEPDLHVISQALPAGTHEVRVVVAYWNPTLPFTNDSICFGSGLYPEWEVHLSVIELRAP